MKGKSSTIGKREDIPLHIIPRGLGKKFESHHHSSDRGVERISLSVSYVPITICPAQDIPYGPFMKLAHHVMRSQSEGRMR
jgi:hypothetical protein